MNAPEPMHDLARGDVGVSRQLSRALRVLMDSATEPQLKNQLRGILEGKGSARDLMHSEAFNRVLDRTMPAAIAQFAAMTDDERQRLAEQGEADLQRLRSQPATEEPRPQPVTAPPPAPAANTVVPGTRRPNRERVVTPDDEDDDDRYFRERNQRGWLS